MNNYHPDVEGIKSRILLSKENSSFRLFQEWSMQFDAAIDLKGKSVLEIGHGGGWYLAEALDLGAELVVGYEISEEINSRAGRALNEFGYKKFLLLKGNGKNLSVISDMKFDFIFSMTVLQHIPTRVTKIYLANIFSMLSINGSCILQVLHSRTHSLKRLSKADLFSIAYSKEEFDSLIQSSGLRIQQFAI